MALFAALALMLALVVALSGAGATPTAAGQPGEGEVVPQSDASVPAHSVTMIGSSPQEAPAETWGIGQYRGESVVVRYAAGQGWSLGPALLDTGGQPLSGFKLAQPEAFRFGQPSPLSGQITANGDGALLGTIPGGGGASGEPQRVLLVREHGGAFQQTAPVPAEPEEGGSEEGGSEETPLLKHGEKLFGVNSAPMVAALEEAGGHAGALVVPVNEEHAVDEGVLHWDGHSWSREPIELPAHSSEHFEVIALGASSPANAWLLARLSSEFPTGSVALFRRHLGGEGETPTWRAVTPKEGGEPGEPLSVPVAEGQEPFTVPSPDQAQVLTVTSEGVWVDGLRRDAQASTTMFLEAEGEAAAAHVVSAWCDLPANAPEGSPPCARALEEPLPVGPSRSIAWANPATPEGLGERVITGLADGVSLRLDGSEFTRVLSLGGEEGGGFGAAFSNPHEGWLGKQALPVHLMPPADASASRLAAWPVSFHDALTAIVAQPGAPVGALTSEALAVGDRGEVARYQPGKGWLPESLLGPGGRREEPRLRAVAWPTPMRAYAVGDVLNGLGQMWLWRGETGLWEPDPAEPENFRGNLLGVAFEPGNPTRGYAVGEQGVLLSYGKTWTQEPEAAIPAPARGASFTSIAFAGSQAIVAYRKLLSPSAEKYSGGLLINEGSGWHVDQSAGEAMGAGVPWAVVGLADGGAAFSANAPSTGAQVFERQSTAAPWRQTSTPFPGNGAAGSLSLFREGNALRAITVGSEPNTFQVESEPPPPPGFPPNLIGPYPLSQGGRETGVLRQTATGWSDEEHELNNAKEPPGNYKRYDTVYRPDPVSAVLVNESGSQGWAVGGIVNSAHAVLDTADVDRYPADGSTPVGVGSAPVSGEPKAATFAIGGGAQCAAPCADRARTRIGPDVWLSAALARAHSISGVRAFLYTGARVTTGETNGPATQVIPYRRELDRYAEVLDSSPGVYPAPSPTDLDGAGTEQLFEQAFSGFPRPFGTAEPARGLNEAGPPGHGCEHSSGCGAGYAMDSSGAAGTVRVIVLDDTALVSEGQLGWLAEELVGARASGEPAIVVGHADLNAQITAGGEAGAVAARVARVLVGDGASAYFYDSPEKNITLPLRSGTASIPSFGTGTLGYVRFETEEAAGGFIGASGFLLAQVEVAKRDPKTNRAPVTARLIPNVGELAMEATDGTLLRRSQVALFEALARRPRSGNVASDESEEGLTSPYIRISSNSSCVGSECANGVLPEFSFSSSDPEVGDFVEQNLVTGNAHAVLLGTDGKPIRDPGSGLFCAYNPGTTTVTVSTGGLSYSLPVTVQAGSVREPCGTTPLKAHAATQQAEPPVPAPAPTPAAAPPSSAPPVVPVPVPASPVVPPAPVRPPALPPPFLVAPAVPTFVPAIVPPPVPTPARPTPPSGTSAVTQPVEAPEREEEEEAAPESVSNEAVAYRESEHEPSPLYLLGVVLLAAFAGASLRGRPGRRGRDVQVAPATLTGMRAQRRMDPRRRWPY
jgi:hypothetical protein